MSPTSSSIRLVPLLCVKCQTPIPAAPDEVAWVCEQCGQGLLINMTPKSGVGESAASAMDVFFSKDIQAGQRGRPYWVTRAQVTITERTTYKGDEGQDSRDFWSAPRLFYIPAWQASLEDTVKLGVSMLKSAPAMNPGSRSPFLPVVVSPGDIRALSEMIVMSVEADRRDYLKTIRFNLNFDSAQLWVLP